jgi:hypothetical protein
MSRAPLALFAAILSFFTVCGTAVAQDAPTVAVMAVGGTIGLDAAAWVEASDAIEARLREAGYRIDDSGLPRRDDCAELACLRGERADRDVDVLVTLTIFAAEGGTDAAGSIVVTMVDADGQYVGEELVEGRVIGVVAALALASARSERERGPEPWVRVSGTPAGAVVVIDGREVGVVPYEGRVEAGEHVVSVRLSGYETFERRFTARSGSTETVEVALSAGGGGGGDRVGSIVTGVGLLAAGAVLTGFGIANASQAGSCVGPAPCAEHVVVAGTEGALFGVGGALLIGGAILLITQPF